MGWNILFQVERRVPSQPEKILLWVSSKNEHNSVSIQPEWFSFSCSCGTDSSFFSLWAWKMKRFQYWRLWQTHLCLGLFGPSFGFLKSRIKTQTNRKTEDKSGLMCCVRVVSGLIVKEFRLQLLPTGLGYYGPSVCWLPGGYSGLGSNVKESKIASDSAMRCLWWGTSPSSSGPQSYQAPDPLLHNFSEFSVLPFQNLIYALQCVKNDMNGTIYVKQNWERGEGTWITIILQLTRHLNLGVVANILNSLIAANHVANMKGCSALSNTN